MLLLSIAVLAATLNATPAETTVSTEWLAQQLENPGVVLVEIGSQTSADHPHIAGARFVRLESIVRRDGWPPDEVPALAAVKKALEEAGIGDDGRIILYSNAPLYATRAWFTLDYLGHGERAAILDGGFEKWRSEGRPVVTQRNPHAPKTFTPKPVAKRIVSQQQMQSATFGEDVVIIDARPAEEFSGKQRGTQVARAGHIPGANGVPWAQNLGANQILRPLDQLRAIYSSVGVKNDSRVIVYCRTGMEASMPYFVLRSLGYDVALYDGSFTEWSRYRGAGVSTSR